MRLRTLEGCCGVAEIYNLSEINGIWYDNNAIPKDVFKAELSKILKISEITPRYDLIIVTVPKTPPWKEILELVESFGFKEKASPRTIHIPREYEISVLFWERPLEERNKGTR